MDNNLVDSWHLSNKHYSHRYVLATDWDCFYHSLEFPFLKLVAFVGVFGKSTHSCIRCEFGNVYPLGLKSTRFAATRLWLKSRVKNNPLKMLKVATKSLSSPPSCAPGRLMSWQQVDIESVRIHHTTRPSADQPHASTRDSR